MAGTAIALGTAFALGPSPWAPSRPRRGGASASFSLPLGGRLVSPWHARGRRGKVSHRRESRACWSLEVSVATSVFVAGTVVTLLARRMPRDTGNALFLGVFGSMQVVDGLLWLDNAGPGLDACTLENKLITRLGLLIIALEPVAALAGTCLMSKTRPRGPEALLYALLFVLTPVAGATYTPGDPELTCVAPRCQKDPPRLKHAPSLKKAPSLPGKAPLLGDVLQVSGGGEQGALRRSTWGNVLLAVDNECACTALTPEGHLLYGGQDIFYSRLMSFPGVDPVRRWVLTEWDAARGGRWFPQDELGDPHPEPLAVLEASKEIPLVLRLAYLAAMAVPYATKVRPRACGASHAAVLVGAWCVGFLSDSHASVWCLANVAQGVLMLADPLLWPQERGDAAAAAPAGANPGHPVSRLPFSLPPSDGRPRRDLYRSREHAGSSWDAIVVGSGIGGLATAALLARAGRKVLVLEQHYRPGGCSHEFDELGGVPFDSGIHYVGGSLLMKRMLGAVCSREIPVAMAPMGSEADGFLYDLFDLGDGQQVAYRRGWSALEGELVAQWPDEADAIREYLKRVRDSGRATDGLMASKFLPRAGFERLRRVLTAPSERLGDLDAKAVVNASVKDPRLRAVLAAGQLIDYNLAPASVSWLVCAGMMNYYADRGGFYPEGGSQRMVRSVVHCIETGGGRVLTRAAVDRVLVDESGGGSPRACGVVLANGDRLEAPLIVSAAGYTTTFERLLRDVDLDALGYPTYPRPSDMLAPSHAHVCAFVTVDGDPVDLGLKSANIHSFGSLPTFGYDVDVMQEAWYADPLDGAVSRPLITLTCPCMKDYAEFSRRFPGTANLILLAEGLDDWFPPDSGVHGRRAEAYARLKARFEPLFLDRLYHHYPLTRGRVRQLDISTPKTSAHFLGAAKGASYGLEWTPAHFNRHLQDHWFQPQTNLDGLLLSGEAVCFGGLYGALAGGYAAASAALGLPKVASMLLLAPPRAKRP